jgi:hypothetical protein
MARTCSLTYFPCYVSCYFPAHSLLRFQAASHLLQSLRGDSVIRPVQKSKNSLYFSLLTGIFGRDGFANNCFHRQHSFIQKGLTAFLSSCYCTTCGALESSVGAQGEHNNASDSFRIAAIVSGRVTQGRIYQDRECCIVF